MLQLRTRKLFLKFVDFIFQIFQFDDFVKAFLSLTSKIILKLLFFLDKLLDLLFFCQDLIWELKALTISTLALGVTILYIMNYEASVLSNWEKMVVVET